MSEEYLVTYTTFKTKLVTEHHYGTNPEFSTAIMSGCTHNGDPRLERILCLKPKVEFLYLFLCPVSLHNIGDHGLSHFSVACNS